MTVTVTPTVELSNIPARVRLNVSASAGETSTTINRLNADGTQTPVRTYDGNPLALSAGVGLIYDYEMPYGTAVSYTTLESPAAVSAQVTVAVGAPWLIHPGVPALSMPVTLRTGTLQETNYGTARGVFYPLGRSTPVVQTSGVRHSGSSSLVISTESDDELSALLALASDGGVLYFNPPSRSSHGIDASYISVADVKVSRWSTVASEWGRDVTMPFDVVDRPAGGSQAQRTYVDLLNYATYPALRSRYSSYTSLLSGP